MQKVKGSSQSQSVSQTQKPEHSRHSSRRATYLFHPAHQRVVVAVVPHPAGPHLVIDRRMATSSRRRPSFSTKAPPPYPQSACRRHQVDHIHDTRSYAGALNIKPRTSPRDAHFLLSSHSLLFVTSVVEDVADAPCHPPVSKLDPSLIVVIISSSPSSSPLASPCLSVRLSGAFLSVAA
ncbi:uncharacterized protein RHOBADRAFT_66176 [Rhodotorula graminis WP1]|uniref:Uncharacterized protein n=1 Tax=Rhodotorula graminis (strain WP1) TaxID=578459 RepID=A0A194S671_RHOGW|nr:uncharacterized protein RHOBADRAFT_66176 [Rhodotorula graminis WP1]KPV76228.1 hypothetical protein RHOBADRAFT_66176 [Rhodotorula graminis WP1]